MLRLCWQRLLCGHKLCLSAENTECHSDSATERASESQRGPYCAINRQLSGIMPADPRSPGPAIARSAGREARLTGRLCDSESRPSRGSGAIGREGPAASAVSAPAGTSPAGPSRGAAPGRGRPRPPRRRLGPSESPGPGRGPGAAGLGGSSCSAQCPPVCLCR
jgi:hypothetical protein